MESDSIIACLMDPLNICRFLAWFCAMIAFSVLSASGEFEYLDELYSVYNCEKSPLDFVVIIGIFSWLITMFYGIVGFANRVSSQFRPHRKTIELSELICSALMGFLWFVAFCWTANKWGSGDACCYEVGSTCILTFANLKGSDQTMQIQAAGSGIAFSFFSWIVWMAIAGLLVYRMFFSDRSSDDDDSAFKGAANPEPTDTSYEEFQNEYTQYDDQNQ